MRRRFQADQRGFTLIETLAALLIFSIMTIGTLPLLASSLKGAALSRSYTVGKNLAVEAMERIRGLPYFVSFQSQPTKVDVVDLYHPDAVGNASLKQTYTPGASGLAGTFTTVCDATTAANPACPRSIPAGHTFTFQASFVNPDGTSPPMPADYAWNAAGNKDVPASQMLNLSVAVKWVNSGRDRVYSLRSLVGDRKYGQEKVRGSGRVDYSIQVLTSFVATDTAVPNSELTAVVGSGESRIESKLFATADQVSRAAQIRLARVASSGGTALDLGTADGASAAHRAPSDGTYAGTTAAAKTVVNTDIVPALTVAGIDDTKTETTQVKVTNLIPLATGGFSFQTGASPLDFWVTNQADTSNTAALKLDPTQNVFSISARSSDGATLKGITKGETTALGAADRKVETSSQMEFKDLRLLPTAGFITDVRFTGAVVSIDNFTASTRCKATAGTGATAEASWSALLRYWRDDDPADNLATGKYIDVSLAGTTTGTVDPLAAIKTENPLVYDDLDPAKDVYLFAAGGRIGYLRDWRSLPTTTATSTADGQQATAAVQTALTIDTAPTNPALPQSGLNISVGKLACEAVDKR